MDLKKIKNKKRYKKLVKKQKFENWKMKSSACMLPRHVAWQVCYNALKKNGQNKDDHPHQMLEKWIYVEEKHIAKDKADGSRKAL